MTTAQTSFGNQRKGRPGQIADATMHNDEIALPNASGAVKNVYLLDLTNWTPTAGNVLDVKIGGQVIEYTAVGTLATDLDGLKAAIDAHPFGGIGVTALNDEDADTTDDSLTFTMNVAGYDAQIEAGPNGYVEVSEKTAESFGADLSPGLGVYRDSNGYVTLTKPAGDIEDVLVGITIDDALGTVNVLGGGTRKRSGRHLARVLRTGTIYVDGGATAAFGDEVFIGTTANDEQGKFFAASGTGRTAIPQTSAKWLRPNVVELKLGK